jgi:hypothetical protein
VTPDELPQPTKDETETTTATIAKTGRLIKRILPGEPEASASVAHFGAKELF